MYTNLYSPKKRIRKECVQSVSNNWGVSFFFQLDQLIREFNIYNKGNQHSSLSGCLPHQALSTNIFLEVLRISCGLSVALSKLLCKPDRSFMKETRLQEGIRDTFVVSWQDLSQKWVGSRCLDAREPLFTGQHWLLDCPVPLQMEDASSPDQSWSGSFKQWSSNQPRKH